MRTIAIAVGVFSLGLAFLTLQARAEPGPCQERDLKAKVACLNVWMERLRNAQSTQRLPPPGAMIAWRPPVDRIDTANATIRFPDGWGPCQMQGSVTPGSAYLKGVTPKEYLESFDPQDPSNIKAGSQLYGGKQRHAHSVTIPGQTVDQRDDLTHGEGDRTHAANSIHGHNGSTSSEPNDPPFAKVIWLCATGDPAIVAWSSYGYGGDPITIARNGLGYSDEIDRSYAVCNTGPVAMTVAFRPLSVSSVDDNDKIEPGECVGMDRPSWLRVSSATGSNVSGTYYAMLSGTFPKQGIKFKNDASQLRSLAIKGRRPIGGAEFSEEKVSCERLPDKSPLRNEYYSACKIPLTGRGSYRLCFPENFADQPDNHYAWGVLRLIVDSSIIDKGLPKPGPNPRSAAPQRSCIDLWSVRHAIVLVAPPKLTVPWNPETIKSVRVSILNLDQ